MKDDNFKRYFDFNLYLFTIKPTVLADDYLQKSKKSHFRHTVHLLS